MAGYYDPTTQNGYSCSECISAIQKCIRRGEFDDALYWAVELHISGHDTRLWNRLEIMVSEDIGPAEPTLPAVLAALRDAYLEQKKRKSAHVPERLFLTHAVYLLAHAKKSRVIDHALIVAWGAHKARRREIPDVALDTHTAKGRAMGRGVDHFFTEGTVLNNPAAIVDDYRDAAHDVMNRKRSPAAGDGSPEESLYEGES